MTIAISPLNDAQVDTLCALAGVIWRHHYPPIIGEAQTEYMLAQRYDPDTVRAELARGDAWWDVLYDNGSMIAFASSFRADAPDEVKLDKLYVHPRHQRMGYGGALVRHVCQRTAHLGFARLVLAVNKKNVHAIAAYRKHGFKVREAVVKDIGGGFVMDDYIMAKELESA